MLYELASLRTSELKFSVNQMEIKNLFYYLSIFMVCFNKKSQIDDLYYFNVFTN